MPIARVQLADGRIARFDVPADMKPADIEALANSSFAQPQQSPQVVQQSAPEQTGVLDAARAFGRGQSFGLYDRLYAGVSSLAGRFQNAGEYGNYGGTYSENLADAQKKAAQFHDEHPIVDTALNIAGGISSGAPIAKALSAVPLVAKAYSAMRPWQQYVTTGAAAGALAGAGNAPEGQMLEGAGTGALTGAVTGAILPPALRGAASLTNTVIGTPVRAAINALRTPEQQGIRLLSKALGRDEVTPAQLESTLQALGPNAMVADAAGKNTLGLADLAATLPGKAKNAGLAALEDRAKGAGGRVALALSKEMGVPSTNFDALEQNLHANMRALSPQYEAAVSGVTVPTTENLAILANDPIIQAGIASAKKIIKTDSTLSQLRGKGPIDSLIKELDSINITPTQTTRAFGNDVPLIGTGKTELGYTSAPSLRAWDYVRRGLDNIISENTDAITGKMTPYGGQVSQLRKALVGELDTAAPTYPVARAAYADEKSAESALRMGRAFMRDDAEVTARHLADMTPAEQKFFKAGAARAVIDQIRNAPDTGMAYAKWAKNPLAQEKLQAAFAGDERGFNAFMGQLQNEFKMGQTHAAVGKNSLTAARAAAAKDVGEPIFDASVIPTSKAGLVKAGLNYLTKPNEEVSAQLLDALLTRDPAKQAAVLNALRGLDTTMNRRVINPLAGQAANALLSAEIQRSIQRP